MTAPARLDSDPRIRLSHFHRYAIACAAVLAAAMLLNLLWLGLFGYDFTLGVPTLWQRAVPVRSDINLDHYPLVLLLLAIIPALDQPRWRNAAALGCVYGWWCRAVICWHIWYAQSRVVGLADGRLGLGRLARHAGHHRRMVGAPPPAAWPPTRGLPRGGSNVSDCAIGQQNAEWPQAMRPFFLHARSTSIKKGQSPQTGLLSLRYCPCSSHLA